TYTKAETPGQPIFSQVSFTSFTVTWSRNSNPTNTNFEVSWSLDNFVTHFSTPIGFSDNFTNNTTNFVSLVPGTTYYVRIRAENGDAVFITSYSVTGQVVTLGVPVPQGVAGAALGVSSINWTWNQIPSASVYRIYQSTSPTTLIVSTTTNSWIETGLSTNTSY